MLQLAVNKKAAIENIFRETNYCSAEKSIILKAMKESIEPEKKVHRANSLSIKGS